MEATSATGPSAGRRLLRSALHRWAAMPRRGANTRDGVTILIGHAWGMGGTIRSALNLAGYLARRHDVQVLSGVRRTDTPFMGAFPPGVRVIALDDRRPGADRGLRGRLAARLRRSPSVLLHPDDIQYGEYSLWSDIALVRRLRRAGGVVIGTRPALNIVIAQLRVPGLRTIGIEQMNLDVHAPSLRETMSGAYPRLDALAVLTERDRRSYARFLRRRAPRLAVIPNTIAAMDGTRTDPDRRVVLAAGRLTRQKGFDLLIRAWRHVAEERPDWKLVIMGDGRAEERLRGMIDTRGLAEHVSLEPASGDLPREFLRASIFAFPSRYEGFPLVLLEAMSKGLAPVAYRCPTGPGEIIEPRESGLLVRPERVRALGRALLEMIGDDELRHRCAAGAHRRAGDYTMDAVGPRWDALIEAVGAPAP